MECNEEIKSDDKEFFIRLNLSKLYLNEDFESYEPKTANQKQFLEDLEEAKGANLKEIYIPRFDPNLISRTGSKVRYKMASTPAIKSSSFNYKKKIAKEYCPERGSRLGTRLEYIGFLELVRRQLCGDGWKIEDAMYSICDNSIALGQYKNSLNATGKVLKTGSQKIGQIYDLANTCKVLDEDWNLGGFYIASGCWWMKSYERPLASIRYSINRQVVFDYMVPWIVLEK